MGYHGNIWEAMGYYGFYRVNKVFTVAELARKFTNPGLPGRIPDHHRPLLAKVLKCADFKIAAGKWPISGGFMVIFWCSKVQTLRGPDEYGKCRWLEKFLLDSVIY